MLRVNKWPLLPGHGTTPAFQHQTLKLTDSPGRERANALLWGPEVLSVKELSREGRIENEGSQESVQLRLRLKSLAPVHEH